MRVRLIILQTIMPAVVFITLALLAGCEWGGSVSDMGDISQAVSLWETPAEDGRDENSQDNTGTETNNNQVNASYGDYQDRIGLKWNLSGTDVKYIIYRSDSIGGEFTMIAEINKSDLVSEVSYPATITQPAVFISDVDLTDGVKFPITYDDFGTPAIDFTVGGLSFTVEFPPVTTWDFAAGEWLVGHKYTRSEVIAKINTAAGTIICKPEGTQYISITAPSGSILIQNNTNISYMAASIISTLLKSGVSKTGEVSVAPVEIPNPDYVNNNGNPVEMDFYYYDTAVTPGSHYYYKIMAVDAAGVETCISGDSPVEGLAGEQGPITDQEFYRIFKKQYDYSVLKFSHFGTNGTDSSTGIVSGTGYYTSGIGISGGSIKVLYTDYSDYSVMIFNGSKDTAITSVNVSRMTGSGNTTGKVTITGRYAGYVRFDLVVTDNNEAGGYFYVKQDGAETETQIPYNFQ